VLCCLQSLDTVNNALFYSCHAAKHLHTQQASTQAVSVSGGAASSSFNAAASSVSLQQSSAFLVPDWQQAFNLSSRPDSPKKLW
jgi:hypothetical protein